MAVPPILIPPFWIAFPPEVHITRLMAGAGPAPMLQASAGWEALAVSLEAQADEMAASLATLAQMWQGEGSERAAAATMPMIIWLRMLALQAMKRALQATAQATSYTTALTTTPQLPELEQNHVTHAVLEATNFLGVNTMPIGFNETDYVRMWDQAATVMDMYQAETAINATFEPVSPPKPILVPGMEIAPLSAGLTGAPTQAPGAVMRNAVFAHVSGQGKAEEAALAGGGAYATSSDAGNRAQQEAARNSKPPEQMQQGMQQGMQMVSQLGSTLGQLPQQLMQGVTQPFQQLSQPLQQISSLFSGLGGGDKSAQVGMLGATPFSNHPAIGGSGAAAGSGLVRAASLPGAGGTSARTPLMAGLVGSPGSGVSAVSVAAGAAGGMSAPGGAPLAAAGAAPLGAGGGAGGPMGMAGHGGKGGGNRAALLAPAPLDHDLNEDEEDDW